MATHDLSQSGLSFLDHFSHFVRVDFSCKQIDDDRPHEFAEELRSQLPALCTGITSVSDRALILVLWPTLFTTCKADATISRDAYQDRGAFLLGIQGAQDLDSVKSSLQTWENDVRTSAFFTDYIPSPLLSTYFVQKSDLGHLIVDIWIWPQPATSQPTYYGIRAESVDSEEALTSFLPGAPSPGEAPSAASAAARSTSPGVKKLTPSSAILNRLKWDSAFVSRDFVVVYEDRHDGMMEQSVDDWTAESTEEHFIPGHKIRAIKRRDTGKVVWHREERIDLISGKSGR